MNNHDFGVSSVEHWCVLNSLIIDVSFFIFFVSYLYVKNDENAAKIIVFYVEQLSKTVKLHSYKLKLQKSQLGELWYGQKKNPLSGIFFI